MNIYISDVGIYKSDSNSYPFTNTASVKKVEPLEQTKSSTDSVVRQAQQAYVAENTPAYMVSISSLGKAAMKSLKQLSANFANMRDQQAQNMQNAFGTAADTSISDKNSIYNRYDERESFTTVDASKSLNAGFTGTESVGVSALAGPSENSPAAAATAVTSDESEETSSVSSNLSRYTDYQLQQLLNDGSISRAEYNTELAKRTGAESPENQTVSEEQEAVMQDPVMKQAVAAYNFQMAYQINSLITQ